MTMLSRLFKRRAADAQVEPVSQAPEAAQEKKISPRALDALSEVGHAAAKVFTPAEPAPGVVPEGASMAMDSGLSNYVMQRLASEGLTFLGYPYLAELTQRAEYRRPAEILAKEMTRRWIKVQAKGDADRTDKINKIKNELKRLRAKSVFREALEHDGFFGRAQIYIDLGNASNDELRTPLSASTAKIAKGSLLGLRVIEPVWTYPDGYNSSNPLSEHFFRPHRWWVMGTAIHASRLMTIVSRQVPDLLKPAYAFGGLSLSQISKPYVDNWLRTRQSVSDVLHNFSVMVMKTDMSAILSGGGAEQMLRRAQLFNKARDNQGLMLADFETEDLVNVSAPLSNLDHLQAQAQEHMSAVVGIPLVVLLGITPSGLNATSEGELESYYAWIHSQQEAVMGPHVAKLLDIVQLSLFGEIDPDITYVWEPLRVLSDKELAETRKTEADTDVSLINAGVLDPIESRKRLAADEDSPYGALDVEDLPEPPQQTDAFGNPIAQPGADPLDPDANPDQDHQDGAPDEGERGAGNGLQAQVGGSGGRPAREPAVVAAR